uniref:Venom peptide ECTX1-Rm57d n=1 Tax=Rhytidoponera metallica TaxID=148364 RepID=A0A8U0LU54_RHYMT|nr:venom peptide precursor ECTX1-Rm57d [Rhytidoponera metallica]
MKMMMLTISIAMLIMTMASIVLATPDAIKSDAIKSLQGK